jgi:5-formyltetrahydrofolate cyclo-ligase
MSKLPRREGEAYGRGCPDTPPVEIQVQTTESHGLRGGLFLFVQPNSKRAFREELLRARVLLAPAERAARSRAIAARAAGLESYRRARTVGFYAAIGTEVETWALAADAIASGKRVAWPIVREAERALAYAACAPDALVEGSLGTRQPPPGALAVPLTDLEAVLVPGVGFDLACRRLGRGRGHYDATLLALREGAARIGLAFELQIVSELPHEPHDVPVDAVVTESRTIGTPRDPGSPIAPH